MHFRSYISAVFGAVFLLALQTGCEIVEPETAAKPTATLYAKDPVCTDEPGQPQCQDEAGDAAETPGDIPGIGMSNARNIFNHVASIDNRASSGDGTLHWTQNDWGFDASSASHVVAYVAVPFPQHDTCLEGDPLDNGPKRKNPCHAEAFASYNADGSWFVTAEDSARYIVWADSLFEGMISRIRTESPGATFTLVGREHGYCATASGQHPEPFAGMHAALVPLVVERHLDAFTVDLHQPSLDYGSGDGTPAGVDCSYFKPDGTHPGDGAPYAAAIIQAHLDTLPKGTGVEGW